MMESGSILGLLYIGTQTHEKFVRQMIVNPEEYVSVIVLITGAHNIFCILKQTNRLGEQ